MSDTANQPAGSVSKIECLAEFSGGGLVKWSMYRHLAPLTVNAILRVLPLDSRVSLQPPVVSIFTPLRVGVEKPKKKLSAGEVAYLPSAALICIFLKDSTSERPLNPLGNIESGLESLENIRPGNVVRLRQAT